MARKWRDIAAEMYADPARRERIEQGKHAMYDVLTLAKLREKRGLTQKNLGHTLGMSQSGVSQFESRIERQDDVYLSTLSSYIEALGGRLEVAAVFEDERVLLAPKPDATHAIASTASEAT